MKRTSTYNYFPTKSIQNIHNQIRKKKLVNPQHKISACPFPIWPHNRLCFPSQFNSISIWVWHNLHFHIKSSLYNLIQFQFYQFSVWMRGKKKKKKKLLGKYGCLVRREWNRLNIKSSLLCCYCWTALNIMRESWARFTNGGFANQL